MPMCPNDGDGRRAFMQPESLDLQFAHLVLRVSRLEAGRDLLPAIGIERAVRQAAPQ